MTEPTIKESVEKWRNQAKNRISVKSRKRQLVGSALIDSISINIIQNEEGGVARVQFIFNAYGRFVDMGVSRGYPIGSRRAALEAKASGTGGKFTGPKPRKFYVRDIFNEGHILQENLIRNYGVKLITTLEQTLTNKA